MICNKCKELEIEILKHRALLSSILEYSFVSGNETEFRQLVRREANKITNSE